MKKRGVKIRGKEDSRQMKRLLRPHSPCAEEIPHKKKKAQLKAFLDRLRKTDKIKFSDVF